MNFYHTKRQTAQCMLIFAACLFSHISIAEVESATQPKLSIKLQEKALNGDAESQAELATFYGQQGDMQEALKWGKLAAEQGNAQGEYVLGLSLLMQGDTQQSITLIESAANKGVAKAQFAIGKMYLWGENSLETNIPKALLFLEQSAKNGYAQANFLLGLGYYQGNIGFPQDLEKAEPFLYSSWQTGNIGCGIALSQLYLLRKDYKKLIPVLNSLSEQDIAQAKSMLSYLYADGDGGLEKNEQLAAQLRVEAADLLLQPNKQVISQEWQTRVFRDAAKIFDSDSEYSNFAKFISCLKARAALNDSDAQFDLGRIYLYGYKQIEPNPTVASSYLESAVFNNDKYACAALASLYMDHYPQMPREEIYQILLKGAKLGSIECNALLGYICQKGDVPNMGEEQAQDYLALAAKSGNFVGHVHLFTDYLTQAKSSQTEQEVLIQQAVGFFMPALEAKDKTALTIYANLIELSKKQDSVAQRTLEIIHKTAVEEEMVPGSR
ncbi:MAG: hypothetical protein SNG49_08740 [Rikenellaceae bacterium]